MLDDLTDLNNLDIIKKRGSNWLKILVVARCLLESLINK